MKDMEKMGTIVGLMTTTRFLPLFICQFLSAFNDSFIRMAMMTLITYYSSDLSEVWRSVVITLALSLFMLPFMLFSVISGQLADKFDKSKLIRWIKITSVLAIMVGVLGFYLHSYIILLLAIFLAGIEASLFGPSKYSILPDHLEKHELLAANGLIEAGTFMAILLGMILGGVAISSNRGDVNVTVFCLVTVSISALIASFFIQKTDPAAEKLKLNFNLLADVKDSINYARKDRDIFLAILGISWFWLIGGIMLSQLPNFTKDTLFSDYSVFSLLLTMFSLGTGIGSITCNHLLKGRIDTQYVPISMLLMTLFMFTFWYSSTFFTEKESLLGIHYFLSTLHGLAVSISVLMLAFFGGIYIVPLYVLLQVMSKRSHRSRIIAINNLMNAVFMVGASIISIILLAIGVTVSKLILILAITNFFTTMYIARILPDQILKSIAQTIFQLFYRVEIIGIENFFKAGEKVLIIANHASFLDPPLLGAFLPKRLVFAIDTYQAKSWWLKPFLSYFRAFPIDPTNPMATKTLIEKLKNNKPVVIFPEGRITVTGSLMKIYEGPGLVADKAGAKLLPIRIDGVQYSIFSRLKGKGKLKLKLFPKITITIMEPQKLEIPNNILGRTRRQIIAKQLYDIMSNMMFEGSKYESTLYQAILDAKKRFGSNYTILEDADHNRLSYKRLIMGSILLGSKIAKFTKPKENIGIFLPNVSGSAVTFFAAQAYGRIPAMLNYSTGVRNIIDCCKSAKIKSILTAHKFIEKANIQHIITALEETGIKIYYLEDIRNSITIFRKLLALGLSYFPEWFYSFINKKHSIDPNDPAVILFTSGSEGTPKGVVLSHSNIQSNVKQVASFVDVSQHDRVFNALPIFHSFGLTGGLLMPIISGVKTFFYPSPLHYRIIPEMIYGTSSTIMFGTDTFLSGYVRYAHPYDFFSIRYVFAGAEKLREETRKAYMDKFGIRIFEAYGVTETSPGVALNTAMHYKAGTVGRILPGMEYYLEPVEGIEKGGRLILSGPNVMLGYMKMDRPGIIQRPEHEIEGKLKKGWHDTGDIVDIDDDGYITILGRAKRFAKLAGEMISLTVVEEFVDKLYTGFKSAVISLPDEKKGEVIALFTENKEANRDSIHQYFKAQGLSELCVPRIVKVVKELPILATGKINYVALKELAATLVFNTLEDREDEDVIEE
jgi:acyl-[acyl-carrier-protein]-phospholipid O-acyltransferase/long-chain-fatty-acid--[acyl-carrier-protein] ligase